jgi:hypothetical protein
VEKIFYSRNRQIIRRIACWIIKATETHSEYVILLAFPWQQWLRERASVLHDTYIFCLVLSALVDKHTASIVHNWLLPVSFASTSYFLSYDLIITMGIVSFPGIKSGRGLTLTPHPLLVPWSWKGNAIPLLPLWAVRPVQSLSACTRVHFTFVRFNYSVLLPSISTEAYDVQLFRIDIM